MMAKPSSPRARSPGEPTPFDAELDRLFEEIMEYDREHPIPMAPDPTPVRPRRLSKRFSKA